MTNREKLFTNIRSGNKKNRSGVGEVLRSVWQEEHSVTPLKTEEVLLPDTLGGMLPRLG